MLPGNVGQHDGLVLAAAHVRAVVCRLLKKALFDEPDIEEGVGGLVLVRDIDFAALSQDTLLPFHGRCHIAYVPSHGVVLGLSKLARLTKLCAKQLHTQDSLARQLLHYLQKQLQPQGALVVIQARHLDYTADQPPQLQTFAAASGCLAATAVPDAAAAWQFSSSHQHSTTSSSGSSGATLEETLELLGASIEPQAVLVLQDAANPLCLLHPGCSCHTYSSSPASSLQAAASFSDTLAGLRLSTTPACSTCGSARLAPHVLRGMSASAAGGLDSPRAPATPDPSENSDTDGSEQGSDLYCSSLLAGSGDLQAQVSEAAAAAAGVLSGAAAAGISDTQQQLLLGGTVSMEAALLQLLADAGIDTTGAAVQAAARRHVLALLAATSGYRQEQPSRPVVCADHSLQQHAVVLQQPRDSPLQQQLQLPQQQYTQYEHHVQFMSQCEHHMLPFHGTLHIQYLLPARGSSSGCGSAQQQPLSDTEALQLVQCYTKRLQVQERITQQVASAVQRLLQPAGVMVVVQAVHMCMVARGVENHAGSTSTRAALGVYEADPQRRCQFLRLVQQHGVQKAAGKDGCSCGC
jgi:GTP cyclohydrolase I